MTVYLSGPMSGMVDHNFPAFFEAEKALKKRGFEVINPASFREPKNIDKLTIQERWKAYMRRDFKEIFTNFPDAIVVLDGWRNSQGAMLEVGVLKELGVDILEYPSLVKIKEGILDEAIRITSDDRRRDYDHPKPNHERIARIWNAYLSIRSDPHSEVTAADVARMMIGLKLVRDAHTPKRDNATDIAGYARCLAMIQGWE